MQYQNHFRPKLWFLTIYIHYSLPSKSESNQNVESNFIANFIEKEQLNKRIVELEEENSNFKEIISELEAEIETEKNNVITERERTQSAEKSASNVSRYLILPYLILLIC